jgi:hypothetical protein
MTRTILACLVVLVLVCSSSQAQFNVVGPGSTPQGDYLRGVGVAAYGIGVGEYFGAMATSINLDTSIRFNEYVAAVLENENRKNAEHRDAMLKKKRDEYNQVRERIFKNPEARYVDKGDTLNTVLEKMNAGIIQESIHHQADVPLSVDEVRRIPFKLAEKGVKSFSMFRLLTVKERGKWPLALQDPQFDAERAGYARALDRVLDEHFHEAAKLVAIDRLKEAVERLSEKLDKVMVASPTDTRYIEGRATVRDLNAIIEMLKRYKIQQALVDLDQYHGTTVNDLRVLMRKHGLQFANADTKEELALFPELYMKLKMHYEKVNAAVGDRPINN